MQINKQTLHTPLRETSVRNREENQFAGVDLSTINVFSDKENLVTIGNIKEESRESTLHPHGKEKHPPPSRTPPSKSKLETLDSPPIAFKQVKFSLPDKSLGKELADIEDGPSPMKRLTLRLDHMSLSSSRLFIAPPVPAGPPPPPPSAMHQPTNNSLTTISSINDR